MKDTLATGYSRLAEDATDSLARLDVACRLAPRSFSEALALSACSELARAGPKGTRSLVAAFDVRPALSLDATLASWRDLAREEERRARGGAPLTLAALRRSGLPVPDQVSESLRTDPGERRPTALSRALEVAAHIPDPALGELAASLILCVEGRTDRIRFLPFAHAVGDAREQATARWRDGDPEPWTALALPTVIDRAQVLRDGVERANAAASREDERLASIGRAAVTARPALEELRASLACTVPSLSADLGVSRPAASDALERLCALGLAVEVTGRRRDRVFACAAALSLADLSLRGAA